MGIFSKDSQVVCPLLRAPCLKEGCEWFGEFPGASPDGKPFVTRKCSIPVLARVIIEGNDIACANGVKLNSVAATIDRLRNENLGAAAAMIVDLGSKMSGAVLSAQGDGPKLLPEDNL